MKLDMKHNELHARPRLFDFATEKGQPCYRTHLAFQTPHIFRSLFYVVLDKAVDFDGDTNNLTNNPSSEMVERSSIKTSWQIIEPNSVYK